MCLVQLLGSVPTSGWSPEAGWGSKALAKAVMPLRPANMSKHTVLEHVGTYVSKIHQLEYVRESMSTNDEVISDRRLVFRGCHQIPIDSGQRNRWRLPLTGSFTVEVEMPRWNTNERFSAGDFFTAFTCQTAAGGTLTSLSKSSEGAAATIAVTNLRTP